MKVHIQVHVAILTALMVLAGGFDSAQAQVLRADDYTVAVDDRGSITLDRDRAPIITHSYAGMFGRLPDGNAIYRISASRELEVEVREDDAPPRLVIANSDDSGVAMRREAALTGDGLRLTHEITVPGDVGGSIDTGFTLNPELTYDATVTMWETEDAEPIETSLGPGDDCLDYRVNFQRIEFVSRWGTLVVRFATDEGLQGSGSLLNGARSTKKPGEWVDVLPLFGTVEAGGDAATRASVCTVAFTPAEGERYLSPRRNVLYNAGFEDWSNPDLPDGWRREPPATAEIADGIAPDSDVVHEGARSLRWSLDSGTVSHATARRGYHAPADLRTPCVFSVFMRSQAEGEVVLRCGPAQNRVTVNDQWRRYSVTAPEEGRSSPRIAVEKLTPGTLWIDAAQLEKGEEPTEWVARSRESIFGDAPFPEDLLAEEIAEYSKEPALGGCGPELSYYTSENQGRLIYDVNLPDARRENASLIVSLTGPGGEQIFSESIEPPLPERAVIDFDVADLPPGTSRASAELSAGGEAVAEVEHDVVRLEPLAEGAEVKINRRTRVLVRNGEEYLAVGSDAGGTAEAAFRSIEAQSANGFNHLHLWSGFYDREKTENGTFPRVDAEVLTEILDAAEAAGMTVQINLSHWLSINHFHGTRFDNPDVSDEQIIEGALEAVRVARDHPALLGWHLIDEPSPAWCTPEWIERIYREVKRVDPYHPAEINANVTGLRMLPFLDGSDFMSIDIYPVPRLHIGVIAPHTKIMRLTGGWRPLRWWIQSFAIVREPTAAEELCMTYQALVEGTRFVLFYNFRPTSYAAWEGLGQIAREVNTLRPALLTEREALPGVTSPQDRVVAAMHRVGDETWIRAANRGRTAVDAQFTLPEDCAGREAEVLFEDRGLQAAGATLEDSFAPLQRHVYVLRP